ncbi:MAG: TerD family protein [Oscillospiraceae bacterium]|nr:TerD family protein [Oscillospiraceae bacterium]
MAVNLQKGQKVDLTKGNAGLKKVTVGLGWDEAQKKGLFSRVQDIDCDALAIVLTDDKLTSKNDVIFYNNLRHSSGCVIHQGDNLTGGGDGDDEQIMVYLSDLPQQYTKVVFAVTIYQAYQRNQHFGMIKNAFIRIVDSDTRQELCRYNLTDNYDNQTAMVFGELYRRNGEWKFNAVGEGTSDDGVSQLIKRFL